MKIETNNSAVAYHIVDGATVFSYPVDARHACSMHPDEWSMTPWSAEKEEAARERLQEQGVELPAQPELSPEDREELDAYNKTVSEAAERLAAYNAKKAEERKEADQVAQDEAIVSSAPPKPDPNRRRPFGRKGEPTPAEIKQMQKQDAEKADRERILQDKEKLDKSAGAEFTS